MVQTRCLKEIVSKDVSRVNKYVHLLFIFFGVVRDNFSSENTHTHLSERQNFLKENRN